MRIIAGRRVRLFCLAGRPVWAALVLAALSMSSALAQTSSPPPVVNLPTPPAQGDGAGPWMEGWVGASATNNFIGGWMGAVAALNDSHNVWTDGFVARGELVLAHYDYPTTVVPTGISNVAVDGGGIFIGYRKVLGNTTVTGYIGANYETDQNPDFTAYVRGTQVGVKVLGEIYSRFTPNFDFYGQGWFTTAFDTWFLMGRPGFLVDKSWNLWIGPEAMFFAKGPTTIGLSCPTATLSGLGSCNYEEARVGGFIHFAFPNHGDVIFSGGYREPVVANGGPNGYYAEVGVSVQLR